MGAEQFFTIALGRNPHQAFDKAREDAYWEWGHAGYTGSIAEKQEFKMMGSVGTDHWRKVPGWFERVLAETYPAYKVDGRLPHKPIPPAYEQKVRRMVTVYDNKWGPALGYEVTGTAAQKIRLERGRKGTLDKVYVFCGYANS